MVNQELVEIIKDKFSKSERREDISAELQNQGWDIGDIDQAVSFIQHQALRQLPLLKPIIRLYERLEVKTANASPKFSIALKTIL